ncbi:MAG: excinuclease ABC subunit UvrA [Planctomycetota bacterium]
MEPRTIVIKGAREHNLRDVSLTLPRGKLICFTGVSGSGKSSLAFDTLFAEGQRRYLESLSSYARQFLGQLAKPDVDQITGLSPAICIQQKSSGWNPRSTVGTITQIQDYLRLLYARVGRQHCTVCGKPIRAQTREQIVSRILEIPAGTKAFILAPMIRGQKGEYRDWFEDMIRQGYVRARVDGQIVELSNPPKLARHVRHHLEVVVDRLIIGPDARVRLLESVENALKLGSGTMIVQPMDEQSRRVSGLSTTPAIPPEKEKRAKTKPPVGDDAEVASGPGDLMLSSSYACPDCDVSFEAPSPQLFSFNSPTGMCGTCDGMGMTYDFDPDLLVPDPTKSFSNYAVAAMKLHHRMGRWRKHIYRGVAEAVGFDLKTPWKDLTENARQALLFGLGDRHITYTWRGRGGYAWRHGGTFEGVIAELREKHRKTQSSFLREYYEKYMRMKGCSACNGARLNDQARAVRIGDLSIHELCALSIVGAMEFVERLELTPIERKIAEDILKELRGRLKFLCDVGLEYLTLARAAPTLSGGESQRIRLASQIGAGLVGVLYVLDEPSIGLHPRDNQKLLDSLKRLRDLGNTVIVVEHDEQTMRESDEIVDFGPGPGVRGGEVVAQGDLATIIASKRSVTGMYLRGEETIPIPEKRRPVVVPTPAKRARK